SLYLFRISLTDEHGCCRIAGQQRSDDRMKHRFALISESFRHLLARVAHSGEESRVPKLRDIAAEIALRKLMRPIVLAEKQSVLERREERHAEIVIVDPSLQTAGFVGVVDQVSVWLYDVRIDTLDEAHDLRWVPVRQSDKAELPLALQLPHHRERVIEVLVVGT